ncbi:hypothetical protein AX16_003793 [Volvariella volvacea WC 439]|nr:hypothetical protein AX16_003793 [Volvariella volvacea WC 439]
MVSRFAIVTLVFFFLSTIFVIHPVSFYVPIPRLGRKKIPIDLLTAPILAIAILWASQCIGPREIREGIAGSDDIKPYNILILFGSLAYMAITLDITGVLKAAAFWVSNRGGSSVQKLYLYFYLMLTFLSVILGNDPVILSGTVFLVYYTAATSLPPTPWIMAEFAAANTASMVLFVGNPTNVVICEGFHINNAAFTAYTILPFLACITTCYAALVFQFRREKHLPKKLRSMGQLNPREVLLDPFGAWVGSLLLGSCLAVVIILSFFHIDVWKITLPFAGAKFIFDICWDHYRYVKRQRGPSTTEEASEEEVVRDDPMLAEIRRAMAKNGQTPGGTPPEDEVTQVDHDITKLPPTTTPDPMPPVREEPTQSSLATAAHDAQSSTSHAKNTTTGPFKQRLHRIKIHLDKHFPTLTTAFPRLPFALIPFAFSQFILIQALARHGWIEVFARWLVIATNGGSIHPTIWIVGVMGVILCNIAGTNIGATILLTKVVRAAMASESPLEASSTPSGFPVESGRAAAIALAVASNIGAVSWTFSASLAGLLWKAILEQKGIKVKQWKFAVWNMLPLAVMTAAGLGVVSAEMAVIY